MIYLLDTDGAQREISPLPQSISSHFESQESLSACRRDSLWGKALLCYVLGNKLAVKDFTVISRRNEKPFLKTGEICFNLSHSGSYVALAVGKSEVGVDVQVKVPYKERVARRYFTESERRFIEESPDQNEAFLRLWVMKESILKKEGSGLSGGLATYDFSAFADKNSFTAYGYHFSLFPLSGAMLCHCGEESETGTEIINRKELEKFIENERGT